MLKICRDKCRFRCSQSASAALHLPHKVKRKMLNDTEMKAAMDAAKKGTLSIKRAAVEYEVPTSTLQNRILGKVMHGTNPGAKPYLAMAKHVNE